MFYFLRYIYISKIKSKKIVKIKVLILLLLVDGRIRILEAQKPTDKINNTDSNLFSLVKFNRCYPYFNLPPHDTSVFVYMFSVFLFQERATGSPLSRCPAPIHLPAQRTQGVTAVGRGGGGVS